MTRTIQASDIATFRPSPAAQHGKEVSAANNMEFEKEEPEFIHIPLSVNADPKVYKDLRIPTQYFEILSLIRDYPR